MAEINSEDAMQSLLNQHLGPAAAPVQQPVPPPPPADAVDDDADPAGSGPGQPGIAPRVEHEPDDEIDDDDFVPGYGAPVGMPYQQPPAPPQPQTQPPAPAPGSSLSLPPHARVPSPPAAPTPTDHGAYGYRAAPPPQQTAPAASTPEAIQQQQWLEHLRYLALNDPAEFQRLTGFAPATAPAAPEPTNQSTLGEMFTGTDDESPVDDERSDIATMGWRGWVARHLHIPLRKSSQEHYEDLLDLARDYVRHGDTGVFGVTSFKGGCGKTRTAVGLAKTISQYRGESVLVLDVDLHGMLQTVAMDSAAIQPGIGTMTTLSGRLVNYGPDQIDLHQYLHLAMPERAAQPGEPPYGAVSIIPGNSFGKEAAISPEGYEAVLDLAKRHFSVIIVDMSQVQKTPLYETVIRSLDGLVMVTLPDETNNNFLAGTRQLLSSRGMNAEHLVSQRVTVINNLFPPARGEDNAAAAARLKLHETADAATTNPRGSDVAEVPFDRYIREHDVLDLDRINRRTRDAYLLLAGALYDAVFDIDNREPATTTGEW